MVPHDYDGDNVVEEEVEHEGGKKVFVESVAVKNLLDPWNDSNSVAALSLLNM